MKYNNNTFLLFSVIAKVLKTSRMLLDGIWMDVYKRINNQKKFCKDSKLWESIKLSKTKSKKYNLFFLTLRHLINISQKHFYFFSEKHFNFFWRGSWKSVWRHQKHFHKLPLPPSFFFTVVLRNLGNNVFFFCFFFSVFFFCVLFFCR